MVTFNRSV